MNHDFNGISENFLTFFKFFNFEFYRVMKVTCAAVKVDFIVRQKAAALLLSDHQWDFQSE